MKALRPAIWLVLPFLLACSALGAGTTTTNTLVIRTITRRFIVYVPDSYSVTEPAPVLFMFHGLGGTAEAAASSYYDWQVQADTNAFIAVFPDSISPPGKDVIIGETVYMEDYDGTGKRWDIAHILNGMPYPPYAGESRCDSQDLDFVLAMMDWLGSNYSVRATHVFTTGHSYGAFFSYYCSVCLSNEVVAFAEHSGGLHRYDLLTTLWWPIDVPANEPRIAGMLLHSTGDTTVGYSNSVLLYAQMTNNGHNAEFISLPADKLHTWDKTKNARQWDFFMAQAPMIDDDGDGMSDPWEDLCGLDSTTNDAAGDPDGDGALNVEEFLANTHPGLSTSVFRVDGTWPEGEGSVVIRWLSASNRLYTVCGTTNLFEEFQPVSGVLTSTPPWNAFTGALSSPRVFYSVRAQKP